MWILAYSFLAFLAAAIAVGALWPVLLVGAVVLIPPLAGWYLGLLVRKHLAGRTNRFATPLPDQLFPDSPIDADECVSGE